MSEIKVFPPKTKKNHTGGSETSLEGCGIKSGHGGGIIQERGLLLSFCRVTSPPTGHILTQVIDSEQHGEGGPGDVAGFVPCFSCC